MDKDHAFDFWYAVNNTEIVLAPRRHLETFGATVLNYHLISELMDSANQVRVRAGRLQAHKPAIITPQAYAETLLEGFGDEAAKYVEWLKDHETEVRILQYGYRLRQESFSEHIVSDRLPAVVERVKKEVEERQDQMSAVVVGVDTPWDVCLVKLFWEIIQSSAVHNIRELNQRRLFDAPDGVPLGVRREIDEAFLAASRNPAMIQALGRRLQKYGLFEEYQDRFFTLIKRSRN